MRDLENFVSSNGYDKEESDPLQNAIRETFDFKRNEKNRKQILDTLNKQMEELRSIVKKSLKPEVVEETNKKETMIGVREYFSFDNKNQNLYVVLGVGLALFLLCLYIYRRCN
tara:strand:- start:1970 stop:2308 length:339 start_codon:yes stop_codon:yes gene_type:complete